MRTYIIRLATILIGITLCGCHQQQSQEHTTMQGQVQTQPPKQYQQQADKVKQLVRDAVAFASKSTLSTKDLYAQLSQRKITDLSYLIGYQMDPHNNIPAGTLVFHGGRTGFCDKSNPNCVDEASNHIGKDLDNMQTLDGVYEVRDWIKLAQNGGGWVAYYWKGQDGKIRPKYAYIAGVPDKHILIAAGFSV